MESHNYIIKVEETSGFENHRIEFTLETHDDLMAIIDRLLEKDGFNSENAAIFATGLKLFAEVTRKNQTQPPFDEIMPLLGQIMKIIKRRP